MAGESTSDREEYDKQFDEFKENGFDNEDMLNIINMLFDIFH